MWGTCSKYKARSWIHSYLSSYSPRAHESVCVCTLFITLLLPVIIMRVNWMWGVWVLVHSSTSKCDYIANASVKIVSFSCTHIHIPNVQWPSNYFGCLKTISLRNISMENKKPQTSADFFEVVHWHVQTSSCYRQERISTGTSCLPVSPLTHGKHAIEDIGSPMKALYIVCPWLALWCMLWPKEKGEHLGWGGGVVFSFRHK